MTGSDTVTVCANTGPAVDAGPDRKITLPSTASLACVATDDGLPNPPGYLTYAWSQVSGPGVVSFTDPNVADATAAFDQTGIYVLQVQVSDGDLVATDTVTITVQPAITVHIDSAPAFVYEGWQVTLHAAGYSPSGDPLQYLWSQTAGKTLALSGTSTDTVSYTVPIVKDLAEAGMVLQAAVTDGYGGDAVDTASIPLFMSGDANHDNDVNVGDLQALAAAWASTGTAANWDPNADFNADGYVNVGDLQILVANWGRMLNWIGVACTTDVFRGGASPGG